MTKVMTHGAGAPITDRDRRNSGIPVKGDLGEAKGEAWGLALGIFILLLMLAAAFLDYAPE